MHLKQWYYLIMVKKINIDSNNSMLKEWLACHNLDKAIPEAKRIVRKQQKRANIVYTIGFI